MGSTAEGNVAEAKALLARGLVLAQSLGDLAAEARLEWTRLNLHHWTDELPEARQAGERALELARAAGLRELQAFSLQDLSYIYLASGDNKRTLASNREATGLWRQLHNQPMLANSLGVEANMHAEAGEYEASLAASNEGYKLSAAINNWWGMAFTRIVEAAIHHDRGEPARAIAVAQTVREHARRAGFIIPLFVEPAYLADIYGDLGAVAAALATLAEAFDLQAPIAHMYQPLLRAVEIRVYLDNGLTAEAQALAEAHASLFDSVRTYYGRGSMFYLLGVLPAIQCELSLLRGEPGQAIGIAERAESYARNVARRPMPEILYWLARGQQAAGDLAAAQATLERARRRAERIGQRRTLWRILALQAQLAAQSGDEPAAQALLGQARSILTSIADHAGSPELRASFLARPAVRAILAEAG